MGLFLDLITDTIILTIKPCTLIRLFCLIGIKAVSLVTSTWLQLLKAVINFHVDVCWGIFVWTIALISLPLRIINALQRERLLEIHLQEMQLDLDHLTWTKKELEEQLQISLKEHQVIETMLADIEEEHDRAIARIDELEHELQDLKNENIRLNKICGKGIESFAIQDKSDGRNLSDCDCNVPLTTDYDASTWKSDYSGSEVLLQDLLMHGDTWENHTTGKSQKKVFLESRSKATQLYPFFPGNISRTQSVDDEAFYRRRRMVLSQSLFSTSLSMLVGMIIWKAEDSCMPLVVALFIVVGMSLKSVVQFFSTIKNQPAADAVALISFNCFILGTLTSPTLPAVARLLAPQAMRLATWMVNWFGFCFSVSG